MFEQYNENIEHYLESGKHNYRFVSNSLFYLKNATIFLSKYQKQSKKDFKSLATLEKSVWMSYRLKQEVIKFRNLKKNQNFEYF